ncbi:MAG: hypothetical protein WD669_13530 [Pirellulales bacterium]
MPLMKHWFLNNGLPAGVYLPTIPGGTFGIDLMSTDEGLAKMRAAFERLARQMPTGPNDMFGPMSHKDWIKLNLRHAELHLSFFHSE